MITTGNLQISPIGFIKDDVRIGTSPDQQIIFFLQIFVKSCGYLSQVSPTSLCTFLTTILAESRKHSYFTKEPTETEKEIISLLYYSALISSSEQLTSLIFGELEYISRTMLEHGMDLSLIGAIVKKFNSQVFAESLADEDGKIVS